MYIEYKGKNAFEKQYDGVYEVLEKTVSKYIVLINNGAIDLGQLINIKEIVEPDDVRGI